tara:strand:- start:555 stop:1490 length:936 start_codon:yes stop_codon:yes gene_type:complete
MRETIRIRDMQIVGINPAYLPGQDGNSWGNDPTNVFQSPWRIGDFISLMISANFKKKVHNSYIKFEYEHKIPKSLKAHIIFKNVVDEFINYGDKTNEKFDDIYDPGLLWLSTPYYVKKYGYEIMPIYNWDKNEYHGGEYPWGEYVLFSPLMGWSTYNRERTMTMEFVDNLCDRLNEKYGNKFYLILPPDYKSSLDSKNINRIISDSLYDIAYIIAHSKCFIGGDSGFGHLAGCARLKQQICIHWQKRKENFRYTDWPYLFINPFSLQGQFIGQTWDMYPQVDKNITDYHEFLLENNSLNEEQIDKLITILD